MLLALALLAAAPQQWSFDVGASPLVRVENGVGRIKVEAIRARGVGVTAEQVGGSSAQQARWSVEARGTPSQVTVRVCCDACGARQKHCNGGVQTNLTLRVPEDARLDLSGVSGRVEVTGVLGEQRIATVNGDVDVEGSAGRLDLSTVSGKIAVRPQTPAQSRIHSVSG